MVHGPPIISLDKAPKAVKKFFESLPDEPVLVEHGGRAVCLVQPATMLVREPTARPAVRAGDVLKDVQGAWTEIPAEVCEAIARGNS